MAIPIRYAEYLNLSVQLYDGNTNRRVFVELRDTTGALVVAAFEITHIASGFFTESSKTMIYGDRLNAIYTVYMPDGVTVDTNYSRTLDQYYLDSGEDLVRDSDISGTIEGLEITGTVEDLELSATLEQEVIL